MLGILKKQNKTKSLDAMCCVCVVEGGGSVSVVGRTVKLTVTVSFPCQPLLGTTEHIAETNRKPSRKTK